GRRVVVNDQSIVSRQSVGDGRVQRTRITLFSVRACVVERDALSFLILKRPCLPDHLVEAAQSTMQAVGTVVDGQRVRGPIERKVSARDAVGVATDDRAKVR